MDYWERLEQWIAGALVGAVMAGLALWRALGRMIDNRIDPVKAQVEDNRQNIRGLRQDVQDTVKNSEDRIMHVLRELHEDVRELRRK